MTVLSPLLSRIGYGLTWRNTTVVVWGGLRGAVGLALALMVAQAPELDESGRTQSKVRGTLFVVIIQNVELYRFIHV